MFEAEGVEYEVTETRMEERRRAKKNNGGSKEDRLSNLPDSILLHILSFLPTKTSVKIMSVVSRRFRHLWEHLQIFDFYNDFSKHFDDHAKRFRNFALFVNFVLLRRKFRDIRKMRLSCGYSYDDEFSIPSIDMWIRNAIGPHLEELHLVLFEYEVCDGDAISFSLTTLAFCPKIVSLSLCGDIALQWLDSWTVCLPLLNKLIIDLDYVDVPFLDNLLSGCPGLQILEVSVVPTGLTTLRVPHSLKRLKCTRDIYHCPMMNGNDFGICLELDALGLKYLSLTNITLEGSTIANLHKVDEAYIDLFSPPDESVSVDPLNNLLQMLSGVKHLVLGGSTMQKPWLFDVDFPKFQHLIHLELILPCFNIGFSYHVLQNCPMLQAFIIQKHKDPLPHLNRLALKPKNVPNCLIYHLSFIHFKGFQGDMDEMKFIGYVLQKALILKTMHVSGLSLDLKKKWEKHRILRKFSDTPRGSAICQLKFD